MTWLIPLLVGALVGLLMGSLGGGGAIIAIPALVYLLGQDPAQATATSLVIVGMTSLVGVAQHGRAGRVAWGEGLVFGLLGIAGSTAGALASGAVPATALMTAFGLLLVVVSVIMWRRATVDRRRAAAGEADADAPVPLVRFAPLRVETSRLLPVLLAASAVGFLTGFFGVGGGFAVVPALTLVLGLPMGRAVGTSLLVIGISSASALLVRAAQGGLHLDWQVAATFTVAAMAFSWVGGRVGAALPAHRLQGAFAVLLVAVAGFTLAQTLL